MYNAKKHPKEPSPKKKVASEQKQAQKERLLDWVQQNQIFEHYQSERQRLLKLQHDLLALGPIPKDAVEIIKYNVAFLNIISLFHDGGLIQYQPDCKLEQMALLNEVLVKCGRQPDNTRWNRSKPGEEVTLDNVFYGNVFGLGVKPARYWISCNKGNTIYLDYHNPLLYKKPVFTVESVIERLKSGKPMTDVIKSEKMWVTDAIVFRGKYSILKFTRNNYQISLDVVADLLT